MHELNVIAKALAIIVELYMLTRIKSIGEDGSEAIGPALLLALAIVFT